MLGTLRQQLFVNKTKAISGLLIARAVFVLCFILSLGVHSANMLAAKPAATVCPSHAEHPFTLSKVAPGTYVRKGVHELFTSKNLAAIANISIIIGETSIAVIDTGGSYCDGKRFLAAIRKISNKPISHIIITHAHPDHSFGTAAFLGERATIIGHANLKRAMAEKGPLYLGNLSRLMGEGAMARTKVILPTKMVKDNEVLDIGGHKLTLTAHKTAHTDHDLTVFDQTTKILWTGDLLFHEHIPVVDGSLLGWRERLDQLEMIKAKHVVPGHGGPLLDWPKALAPEKAYLQALIKDLRTIIEEGGTMREAQTSAGHSQKNLWRLFDDFNARNASTGFAELEWE